MVQPLGPNYFRVGQSASEAENLSKSAHTRSDCTLETIALAIRCHYSCNARYFGCQACFNARFTGLAKQAHNPDSQEPSTSGFSSPLAVCEEHRKICGLDSKKRR